MSAALKSAPPEAPAARRPILIASPGALPVPVEIAKAHLRVDHAEEDALIERYLAAATAHLDGPSGVLGRCLVSQRWRQDFACWGRLRLPFGPIRADGLVGIEYVDPTGSMTELALDDLVVATDARGAFVDVEPAIAIANREDAVRVTFEAGQLADELPVNLHQAILMIAAHLYDNRELSAPVALSVLPFGISELVDQHRLWSFG